MTTEHDEALARHPELLARIKYVSEHPELWVPVDPRHFAAPADSPPPPDPT